MRLTTTVNISNCERHPLMVEAILNISRSEEGWTWEIERILTVELLIGDKVGVDITRRLSKEALTIIENDVNECEDQIFKAIAERRQAV